jgi:hypothetical protein
MVGFAGGAPRREPIVPGMKIELLVCKNIRGNIMKKRNKRTEIMAHEDLSPLTEEILARMGQEGAVIRQRLKTFYRSRSRENHGPLAQPPDETVPSPKIAS